MDKLVNVWDRFFTEEKGTTWKGGRRSYYSNISVDFTSLYSKNVFT